MDRTLLSLAPSGECEQHAKFDDDTPCGLGVLPDGKLIVLTMFRKRLLTYSDGQLSLYADLSGIAAGTIDDMIIGGLGRAYVGDLGFDLPPPPDRSPVGRIILVAPDGATRVVADGLRFPNGIAVSVDNSRLVVAEMDGEGLARLRHRGRRRPQLSTAIGKRKISRWDLPRSRWRGVGRRPLTRTPLSAWTTAGASCSGSRCPAAAQLPVFLGGAPAGEPSSALSAATSYEELRQRKSSARIDVVEVEIAGAGNP